MTRGRAWAGLIAVVCALGLSWSLLAQDPTGTSPAPAPKGPGFSDPLRRGVPISEEARPLPMARIENADLKRKRAYPDQPPTIPHAIDGYQVDRNSNRCLLCHSRANAETFQAPMVSVTHFLDREGQVLGSISPRRYFCTQCHVVQADARPIVPSKFIDVDELLTRELENRQD